MLSQVIPKTVHIVNPTTFPLNDAVNFKEFTIYIYDVLIIPTRAICQRFYHIQLTYQEGIDFTNKCRLK